MRAILIVVFGWMTAGIALAGDLPVAPPSPMVEPFAKGHEAKVPLAQTFGFGASSFKLGHTAFDPVMKQLGGGSLQIMAGEFQYVCYDLPQSQQRVWMAATDEMGDGSIDSITVKRLEAGDPKSRLCPALPARYQPLRIDGVVQLGTSRNELIQRFGAPVRESGVWLVFNGGGDLSRQSVTVRLEAGKVAFLYAENTSTD